MISTSKLIWLYEIVINNSILTTNDLKKFNFTTYDITKLVKDGVLKRNQRGVYSFNDANKLLSYYEMLFEQRKYDKASKCLEKCYRLDPDNPNVCFKLFYECIRKKDYDESFNFLTTLQNSDEYKSVSNIYLYLLSHLTNSSDIYNPSDSLTLDDVLVTKDYKLISIESENEIRKLIMNNDFLNALKKVIMHSDVQENYSTHALILKHLLEQIIEKNEITHKDLLVHINNKDYENVIILLDIKKRNSELEFLDKYILKLINVIMDIEKNRSVPLKKVFICNDVFIAIDGENYELAMELQLAFMRRHNSKKEKNIIYLLLNDINDLIKETLIESRKGEIKVETKKENDTYDSSNDVETIFGEIDNLFSMPITLKTYDNYKSNIFLTSFTVALINKKFEVAYDLIDDYMSSIGKSKYMYIVLNLIKLDILQNNPNFNNTLATITEINRNSFTLDVSSYINKFYSALSNEKYDEAEIYLNIVLNSELSDELSNIANQLKNLLNATKKAKNYTSTINDTLFGNLNEDRLKTLSLIN